MRTTGAARAFIIANRLPIEFCVNVAAVCCRPRPTLPLRRPNIAYIKMSIAQREASHFWDGVWAKLFLVRLQESR